MKKLISILLLVIFNLSFVIPSLSRDLSLADVYPEHSREEYRLGAYDTIELGVVNHPELAIKQTISPDGKASLPLLGVVSAEGQTLQSFQKLLTDNYSAYIDNPQITINLTPKPIYVVQYDLKKDTWEVKMAKSIDEARAYADLAPSVVEGLDPTLTVEHGNVYKVTMSKKPDFFEDNWYKVLTGAAVLVGIYSTVRK
jgi:hypothetical protein